LDQTGEPVVEPLPEGQVIGWKCETVGVAKHKCSIDRGKKVVVVYGASQAEAVLGDLATLNQFLTEYAGASTAPLFGLHINLGNELPAWEDVGEKNNPPTFGATVGVCNGLYNGNAMQQMDVMIDLPACMTESAVLGWPVDRVIRGVLANEATNVRGLEGQVGKGGSLDPWNEAYSSIADWASVLDPNITQIFLGGRGYEAPVAALARFCNEQMALSGEIPRGWVGQTVRMRQHLGLQFRTSL
jgi:hypothetical protein